MSLLHYFEKTDAADRGQTCDSTGMAKADGLKFVTHDYKISFYE